MEDEIKTKMDENKNNMKNKIDENRKTMENKMEEKMNENREQWKRI